MRKVRVKFSNGEIFDIPVDVIAEDRAKYWAQKGQTQDEYEHIFADEYELCMNDSYEPIDWAFNNMNWSDLKACAVKVKTEPIDYDAEWCNVESKIVEE